ncbi:sigma-70 family RNA polymerase sigma factor [Sediminibacterium roseum]|uniref:Sigma-70 family RNA polymerase sigma factor n=1 Tax=Sediminibacterium roseum TaxID=1978412 RepID=A0ABW9ZU01_9BACT|nr:sigma-70 family RNA polymerase sigma factor [Sediminibacterium roseum]NCI50484.1 sigma-70 family RNA polymerase sigma factor [Sediminibacterium roseum]
MGKEKYDHITDNELLERFYSDHDNQWLGIVLQRYTLLLLGVCMKYLKNEEEAKDAVQHIFLKAITELAKYKVSYIKSWLYMVARNHCLMKLRDKNIFIPVENTAELAAAESSEKELADKETTLSLLETSLAELNPEQKTCVTLFYLQKKSYQEIVEATGFSLLQVKSYIQNGKRNLKLLVEKKMKPSG